MLSKIQSRWSDFKSMLFKPVDASCLVVYRIVFGAIMLWEVWRYFYYERIQNYYIYPDYNFTYDFFHWVKPLEGNGMFFVFAFMGLLSIQIMLGLFFRMAAICLFITFTYCFLLEQAKYLNHFYFVILLLFLTMCTNTHRFLSIDNWAKGEPNDQCVPFWQYFLLRLQTMYVYLYASFAKMNPDWIRGEPLRDWLYDDETLALPLLGQLLEYRDFSAYLFSWGGLFFDGLIGFFLLYRKTRLLGFIGVLSFNITNYFLFSIGIFPWTMIACTILFCEPDFARRCISRLRQWFGKERLPSVVPVAGQHQNYSKFVMGFLLVYVSIQSLAPFRHFLYEGRVDWTEEGHRFSWRQKLRDKDSVILFNIYVPNKVRDFYYFPSDDLTRRQRRKMGGRPDMSYQYVQHIKQRLLEAGIERPLIKALVWTSLNGRPYQWLIDPKVNLSEEDYVIFGHNDWVTELKPDQPIGEYPRPRHPYQVQLERSYRSIDDVIAAIKGVPLQDPPAEPESK